MSILGIGPSLALGGGGSLIVCIIFQVVFGFVLRVPPPWDEAVRIAGIVLCAAGVVLWLSSAAQVVKGFRSKKLVTSGVFRITRNPLYSAFIVFIVPGIACIANNFLYLIVTVVMYEIFKSLIWKEEEYLLQEFGDEYSKYAANVPQIIPFVKI